MEKATYIQPEDLQGLVVNEDGTIQIPDNIEIYIKPSVEDKIKELEAQLDGLNEQEPDENELIEYGRMFHPYYEEQIMKEELLKEIKELKV